MNAPASILCALLLCSCATDPNAGMVAARITGMKKCLWFHGEKELQSAAVFPFGETWYVYRADIGSYDTYVPLSQPPPTLFGGFWANVLPEPRDADLLNGCLPRAIAEVRAEGGKVRVLPNGFPREFDAQRVP